MLPFPHILLTEFMDSILLLCVWKGEELQCLSYGPTLFHLAAEINQSFTESFHRKISVLKLRHLAVVATCILRALARAKTDVQLMPVFVHLFLIMNVDKRGKKG